MRFFGEYQSVFESLDSQSLILTPNQRLSQFLAGQYGLWQQGRGLRAWPSLRCMALQGWLHNQWTQLQAGGHAPAQKSVLTPEQQRQLWVQIIGSHKGDNHLLMEDTLADLVSDAWGKLRLWQKSLGDLPESGEEMYLFKRWVREFQRICRERHLITSQELWPVVVDALEHRVLVRLPQQCIFNGFDEFSPVELKLIRVLEERQVQVHFLNIALEGDICRVRMPDAESELYAAAKWAAAHLQRTPEVSIAIVVPKLAQVRAKVERIFHEVFEPQSILPEYPRHAPAFNLSAAQPLAQAPVIAAALDLLQFNRPLLEREVVSRVLHSPFIGGQAEYGKRAQLDARLQKHYLKLSAAVLRAESGQGGRADGPICPIFHQQLQALHALKSGDGHQRRRYSAWAELFSAQLRAFGWPGERELDTFEFQQISHWSELLAQLAAFDGMGGDASFSDALNCLTRLAYQPFHVQTGNSPVQVLGLLEAAGQQFDYLWVTGLDDRLWPEPCQPNPILPASLQRQWRMPRASWERELDIAQKLTARLRGSARVVRISYPAAEGDQVLRPSPLIADLPELDAGEIDQYGVIDYYEAMLGNQMQPWQDDQAPPLAQDAKAVRGGSAILKDMAACPFKAFAKHRLHAVDPEPVQPGIDPALRGNLLHKALELIWAQLNNQKKLLALADDEVEQLLNDCLRAAWADMAITREIGERQKQLEWDRARRLLGAWLELEKARPPFEVVTQEALQTFEIGPLKVRVRFDRIDRLQDGQTLAVVDYKTGQTDIKHWASSRPDEPQVPMYAMALLKSVRAAAFGQISVHEVQAKGISAEQALWPGLKTPDQLQRLALPGTWPDLLDHWRQVLVDLAEAFVSGRAVVDPKSAQQTCRFCDLQPLCRASSHD